MQAHPASTIQRCPIRLTTWHRRLHQHPSIFRESSRKFPRERARSRRVSRKSIQNRTWEKPRGMKNRTQIDPRTLSGRPATPKSVPKASRERLGSVSGHPWRAPGAPSQSPSAARDARKSARDRPEGRRVDQNRRRVASEIQKIKFFPCGSIAKRYRSEVSAILVDFRIIPKVCEPSEVSCLPAKTEVRPLALRVESLARCKLGKRQKST